MIDPSITAATTAVVGLLVPYLAEAGTAAAKEVGKESVEHAGKVLGWLRSKLTVRGQDALAALEADPKDELNQQDLRTQLSRLLAQEPGLVPELQALLKAAGAAGPAMTQTVGDHSQAAQVAGDGNSVSFQRG